MTVLGEPRVAELPPDRPRRRRRLRRLLIVLVLLGAAVGTLFNYPLMYHLFKEFRGSNHIVLWQATPDSTTYIDPVFGWMVEFPNSWRAERIRKVARGFGFERYETHGVFISNTGDAAGFLKHAHVPAGLVAVRVQHSDGHLGVYCDHDTPLPLSLTNAKPVDPRAEGRKWLRDEANVAVKELRLRFSVRLDAMYELRAWVGSRASAQDLAILDQIVGSVYYNPPAPPPWLHVNGCDALERF